LCLTCRPAALAVRHLKQGLVWPAAPVPDAGSTEPAALLLHWAGLPPLIRVIRLYGGSPIRRTPTFRVTLPALASCALRAPPSTGSRHGRVPCLLPSMDKMAGSPDLCSPSNRWPLAPSPQRFKCYGAWVALTDYNQYRSARNLGRKSAQVERDVVSSNHSASPSSSVG
jgi:hypothetical protein